jgi:energy-coupling factor transporter ATP-binding protein EcfA2
VNAAGARLAPADCFIEARGVVKSFGQTQALRGASISVAASEIVAIMGPSGSGKSTLLHCLAGILVPESGEINFHGRRIDTLSENERTMLRRDRFGFATGVGLLGADLFLQSQFGVSLRSPGLAYYGCAAGGLALSFLIITATLPLLNQITGPEFAKPNDGPAAVPRGARLSEVRRRQRG